MGYIKKIIAKKNKNENRILFVPDEKQKVIQKNILEFLYSNFEENLLSINVPNRKTSKDCVDCTNFVVHGGVHNRSNKTCAKSHLGAKSLLKIDLRDAFNCVDYKNLKIKLSDLENENYILENILYNKKLPQGAPTSNFVFNIYMWELDVDLMHLAKEYGLRYTRYIDDFIFSSIKPRIKKRAIWGIMKKIQRFGFKINRRKTKVYKNINSSTILGLSIKENKEVVINRKTRDKFKAILHNAAKKDKLETVDIQTINGVLAYYTFISAKSKKIEKELYFLLKNHRNNLPPKMLTKIKKIVPCNLLSSMKKWAQDFLSKPT